MTKFSYKKSLRGDYYPIIDIFVTYGNKTLEINTLIDSGATISVFKTNVAKFLGIKIESGKVIVLGGVGGRIKGYLHDLEFKIANRTLVAPVIFSYEYTVSLNLLGRSGVFENFKIIFDENNLLVKLA